MARCNWPKIRQKFTTNAQVLRGFAVCASIFGLLFYVSESYIKLQIKPEVLVNEKLVNSRSIPFPAVTLCSPLVAKGEALNLTKLEEDINHGNIPSDSDLDKLQALSHVCNDDYDDLLAMSRKKAKLVDKVDILDQISPGFEDTFSGCSFENAKKCEHVFVRSLTDLGYCFTFNMLRHRSIFNDGISRDFDSFKHKSILKYFGINLKVEFHDETNDSLQTRWTLEGGYKNESYRGKPVRATRGRALSVQMKTKKSDLWNLCSSRRQMVVVFFHMPNELPTLTHSEKLFKLSTANLMKITARVKQNDITLKNFRLDERGCFFEGEQHLKFFKTYTKINCEYECLVNFTYQHCGCVKVSMPRTESMKVCNFTDIECYQPIAKSWPNDYYYSNNRHTHQYSDFPCGCMPLCTEIKYYITDKTSVQDVELNDGYIYSSISIWFEDSQIITRTNYVTYRLQNFISDVGGLIGLFLGFSLLSLFELILTVCSYLRRTAIRWINGLRCKSTNSMSSSDNTLTEVISFKEIRTINIDVSETHQRENVFTIPGYVETCFELEDLEDYQSV